MSKKYQEYIGGKITIQSEDRWNEIEEFNLYHEEKKKIQEKYESKPWLTTNSSGHGNKKDPFEQEWWDDWCKYKKEISDLLLQPEGNFTKFLYQIRPERQDAEVRIWLRGAYNTEKYNRKPNEK